MRAILPGLLRHSRSSAISQQCDNGACIRARIAQARSHRDETALRPILDYRVSYEHSFVSAPHDFIAQVPSQLVIDVPVTVPRALLPEFLADLIRERSPTIGRIRNLRIL